MPGVERTCKFRIVEVGDVGCVGRDYGMFMLVFVACSGFHNLHTKHKLWYGLWHVLFRVLCAVIHPHSYCMKGGRKGGEVGQERESEERGGKKEGGSL